MLIVNIYFLFFLNVFYSLALTELAHREYQASNYVNAEKHCMTLLQHDPQNISILLLLSSIHFQQKNFDKLVLKILYIIHKLKKKIIL